MQSICILTRQLSQRKVSEFLGRTITVKFSTGGKVTKEMILSDNVMNLPTDSCQLCWGSGQTLQCDGQDKYR